MTTGRVAGMVAVVIGAACVAAGAFGYARASVELKSPAAFVPAGTCLDTEQVAGPFTAFCASHDVAVVAPFAVAVGVIIVGIALIAVGAMVRRSSAVPAPAGPVLQP